MTDTITVVESGETIVIEIDGYSTIPGPPGPAGPEGPSGPQGPHGTAEVSSDAGNSAILGSDDLIYVPPSALALPYVHTQALLARTWVVQHQMGTHPSIHAEDAVGTNIYGTVTHISNSVLLLDFAVPCTGKAYCS